MELKKATNKLKETQENLILTFKDDEELNEAIDTVLEELNNLQKENDTLITTINKQSKDISEQLKELDKKDKVIDLMAELLCSIDVMNELGKDSWNWNKEQMQEYFYKKVEEENICLKN